MEKLSWESWNGKIKCQCNNIVTPRTEEEMSSAIKKASKVRIFGEKRSSADIISGVNTLISLKNYNKILSVDEDKKEITVQSGIMLKNLIIKIESMGWSIPCLPDIDAITVGGAISTGTHGTGRNGKMLVDYVTKIKFIKSDGSIEIAEKGSSIFDAIRVSIGMLGVISEITFRCEPLYYLNIIEAPMKDSEWLPKYKKMVEKYNFLRILYLPHTNRGYVIRGEKIDKSQVKAPQDGPWFHKYRRAFSKFFYTYTPFFPPLTIIANKILYYLFFNSKIKKDGTLYGVTVTKSRGSTLELAEWSIPLSRFDTLFKDLKKELDSLTNLAFAHIPMDIRFIKKDSGWLSNACEEDTVTIGCISRNVKYADHYKAFDSIEKIFLKHGGRPHWAKRFSAGKEELSKLYPKWNDFIKLRRQMDPDGKFLNPYLQKIFE